MAERSGDTETMATILDASKTIKTEEAVKAFKGFDKKKRNEVKMGICETRQHMKLDQIRFIANLLLYTGKKYIAVASQDKVCGT